MMECEGAARTDKLNWGPGEKQSNEEGEEEEEEELNTPEEPRCEEEGGETGSRGSRRRD